MSNRLQRTAGNANWRSLTVIFYSLLAGQLLFAAVIYFLVVVERTEMLDTLFGPDNDFTYLALYGVAMLTGAYFMDQTRSKNIPATATGNPTAALNHYRVTIILRSAIWEAGTIMVLVCALLLGNVQILWLALGLSALGAVLFRPRREEFRQRYDVR